MERLNYSPDEIREAFRYVHEKGIHIAQTHAANWRTKYTQFVEAVLRNQEALKLLARLFDGHQTVSGSAWYKAAADRKAPPWPADRYERLALGWKLVTLAVQKVNPDGFDAREKVDLPYVLVNSDLPGAGLSEKYESFRVGYIIPFVEELERLGAAIERRFPPGAKELDLWDAAIAAFAAKDEDAPAPAPAAPEPAASEAAEAETGSPTRVKKAAKGGRKAAKPKSPPADPQPE